MRKRKHSFWYNPVGDLLNYLCKSQPHVENIIVIIHNAKAFALHFILNRAILLKLQLEMFINGMKIMCMWTEHLVLLDSISFLPFVLCKLRETFGLTVSKSWYPHYFNTRANLDYVRKIPDV